MTGAEEAVGGGEEEGVSRWGCPRPGVLEGPCWAAPEVWAPPPHASSRQWAPPGHCPRSQCVMPPGETAWCDSFLPQPEVQGHQEEEGCV